MVNENFIVPEKPEFTDQIRKFKTTDPGHADLFNPVVEALLCNEVFLKAEAGKLSENLDTRPASSTIKNIEVISKAQYDALSASEKSDPAKIYFYY